MKLNLSSDWSINVAKKNLVIIEGKGPVREEWLNKIWMFKREEWFLDREVTSKEITLRDKRHQKDLESRLRKREIQVDNFSN